MPHMQLYLERTCPACRKSVRALALDYGSIDSLEDLDEKVGQSGIALRPLACPACGREGWPEDLVAWDATAGAEAFRVRVGSAELPVVGGEGAPYGVVRSPEEAAEYERGLARMEEHFRLHEEEFWRAYSDWALARWDRVLKEVAVEEWRAARAEVGLAPRVQGEPSAAAFRRDARERFGSDPERRRLWRVLNRFLVEQEFVWTPIEQWPVERWVRLYGRERVTWITLHIPLPEELERWRTEKLAELVPRKPEGPQAELWERIGQLGREVERWRRRAEELSRQLAAERAGRARLEEELAAERARVRELSARPPQVERDPEDARRIARLKALVRELRAEVRRLAALVPGGEVLPEPPGEESPPAPPPEVGPPPEDVLAGRTVAVFGRLGEPLEGPVRMLWHEGEKADASLDSLVAEADVLVVLTRRVSHEVMWAVKEAAADRGVPVVYLRETGTESVLRAAARALGVGVAGK
ncbi:MAG: DUF2325 domain-containing protein [Moorellales bacterium]